jgi:hypothetical protein
MPRCRLTCCPYSNDSQSLIPTFEDSPHKFNPYRTVDVLFRPNNDSFHVFKDAQPRVKRVDKGSVKRLDTGALRFISSLTVDSDSAFKLGQVDANIDYCAPLDFPFASAPTFCAAALACVNDPWISFDKPHTSNWTAIARKPCWINIGTISTFNAPLPRISHSYSHSVEVLTQKLANRSHAPQLQTCPSPSQRSDEARHSERSTDPGQHRSCSRQARTSAHLLRARQRSLRRFQRP